MRRQNYSAENWKDVYEYNENWVDQFMKYPVTKHINHQNEQIENLIANLDQSTQTSTYLRNEFNRLALLNTEEIQDITNYVMEDLNRLQKTFQQISEQEQQETNFLKAQTQNLVDDKIRLQQNCIIMENRILETEKDMGFLQFE